MSWPPSTYSIFLPFGLTEQGLLCFIFCPFFFAFPFPPAVVFPPPSPSRLSRSFCFRSALARTIVKFVLSTRKLKLYLDQTKPQPWHPERFVYYYYCHCQSDQPRIRNSHLGPITCVCTPDSYDLAVELGSAMGGGEHLISGFWVLSASVDMPRQTGK